MPCMCWYNPSEESKKRIKDLCITLVNEIKDLEKIGDPLDISMKSTHLLLDHLYTGKCSEKKDKNNETN